MRPGWADALAMSRSALPCRRLLDIDARLEHAAARSVIIAETIVVDQGKVLVSRDLTAAAERRDPPGLRLWPEPRRPRAATAHRERRSGAPPTMVAVTSAVT
jgi:hypothetical protein